MVRGEFQVWDGRMDEGIGVPEIGDFVRFPDFGCPSDYSSLCAVCHGILIEVLVVFCRMATQRRAFVPGLVCGDSADPGRSVEPNRSRD